MKVYKSAKAQRNILLTYDRLIAGWGIQVSSVDITTRYGSTHVHIFGNPNGKPLVLFHGVGDDSALMWFYNAADLAAHFLVYTIDTIGGPGKSIPNTNYNKDFKDEFWIDDVLDGLKLETVNLAGVSHGGYLVQYYTLVRPDRVEKAISLASSIPGKKAGNPLKLMLKIFLPEALFPTRKNVIRLLRKLSGSNAAAFINNPLILEHFIYLLRGYNNMAMGCHKIKTFSEEQINLIRNKVLYLAGDEDPFFKLGGKAMLQKYGMNACYFKDAGHGINHEIASEINRIMIAHFTA